MITKPTIKAPDNSTRTTSNFGNRFMFTGREYDTETSNYYYRARYYSPKLGRFLQPDPIKYESGLNLYTYCLNNPVIWKDPLGLWQVTVAGGYYLGGRVTVGRNNGQWSGSMAGGLGMGFYVNYDSTNTGTRNPGFSSTRVSEVSVDSGNAGGSVTLEVSGHPGAEQVDLTTSIGTPDAQFSATKNINTGKVSTGSSISVGGIGVVSVAGFSYTGQEPTGQKPSEKQKPLNRNPYGDFIPLRPPGGGEYT